MGILDDLRADYAVNRRLLDRMTVTAFRVNQASRRGRFQVVKRVIAKVLDALWLQGVVGADLSGKAVCGPGLRLPHGGRNVVLDPGAVIGSNATFFPNSGVGRERTARKVAVVGDNVTVGRNSMILGPITVGDGATIGGNSLVIRNVAPGTTVIGSPALPIGDLVRGNRGSRTQDQQKTPESDLQLVGCPCQTSPPSQERPSASS